MMTLGRREKCLRKRSGKGSCAEMRPMLSHLGASLKITSCCVATPGTDGGSYKQGARWEHHFFNET